jgi:hypothetical protein
MTAIRHIEEAELADLKDPIANDRAVLQMSTTLGWKTLRAYVIGLQKLLAETNKLEKGETIESYGARRLADDHAMEYLDKVLSFVETTASALNDRDKDEANKKKPPKEEGVPETPSE